MAVDVHPSRRPARPAEPPKTSTTEGTCNKIYSSGQDGVPYGFRHEVNVHGDATTMAHHFHDAGHKIHPKSADKGEHSSIPHKATGAHLEGETGGKAKRPGDQKANDEPG